MFSLFLFLIYLALVGIVFSAKNQKWWIKVDTKIPVCTYYFGPFESIAEAESNQVDYLQDLQQEEYLQQVIKLTESLNLFLQLLQILFDYSCIPPKIG